jgi:hypothetical protein
VATQVLLSRRVGLFITSPLTRAPKRFSHFKAMEANNVRESYTKLAELLSECNYLRGVKMLLDWDQVILDYNFL